MGLVAPWHVESSHIRDQTHLLHWQKYSLPLSHQGSTRKFLYSIQMYLFFFSCSFMSYSLQLSGLQHARLPCPSPSPRVCSDSCPLSRWCHPAISSCVVPFENSCPQSFTASGSFPVSWLFASRRSIRASASVLPVNIQGWFPLGSNI